MYACAHAHVCVGMWCGRGVLVCGVCMCACACASFIERVCFYLLLSFSLPLPLPLSGGPFLSLCDPSTYLRTHAHNILFSDCRCRGVSLICTKTKGRNQTTACGQTKTKDSNAKTGKGTAPSHRLLFYYARHERRSRLRQHGPIL